MLGIKRLVFGKGAPAALAFAITPFISVLSVSAVEDQFLRVNSDMTISAKGNLGFKGILVGNNTGGATLTITDAGFVITYHRESTALWGGVDIGHDADALTGNCEIANGGMLAGGYVRLGGAPNAVGSMRISGAGSALVVNTNSTNGSTNCHWDTASLYVGWAKDSKGQLTVSAGGMVSIPRLPGPTSPGGTGPGLYLGKNSFSSGFSSCEGVLNGNGGNIDGRVFAGKGGRIAPGDPASGSAGRLNFINGGAVNFTSGARLELDINSADEHDILNFVNGGELSFKDTGEGAVVLFLRLGKAIQTSKKFDLLIAPGVTHIYGLTTTDLRIECPGAADWRFWLTQDGVLHGAHKILAEASACPLPGVGAQAVLVAARLKRRVRLARPPKVSSGRQRHET
jgi:hypothetical protein